MNILLLGGGGREHALAWKLAQSATCDTLYAAPGNPGIAQHAELVALDPTDHGAVIGFCRSHLIGLVVVGPEAPLVDGIADSLNMAGIPCFGPSCAAAKLEGSKGFTKDLCAAAKIPTAAYVRYHDKEAARAGLAGFGLPVVIKADGLAAGKGVVIADTTAEAEAALDDMFGGSFGVAGEAVVIEEFLTGEEVSLFAITDGTTVIPFGTAQDHKRIGEGDTGPNTGGMGAYSPATVLTPELEARAMDEIVRPTVAAMAARGTPFVGVLFAGLMLTDKGPQLIEYNARFGDPETQVLLPRFTGDLAALMLAAATGKLDDVSSLTFDSNVALTVVLAARGYPAAPSLGGSVLGRLSPTDGTLVFMAGVRATTEGLVASGGRVLAATGTGTSLRAARDNAYAALAEIDFIDGYWRTDIGWRELDRQQL
ncbi:phosphoribosylamine--glycine ligase [Sphingomonas sp. SUN039]|uniref:phosphoribosylamine--glycine ligase n=1 Tax=Sphingomonas sp. SUN039 TaxID=2937787 RepID=UPI0021643841|nr:phosphoribosylamine--glycine ligase [Sphingomonas sp. SUN039]UVO54932.1 phosphoribosylamine--glycine ligase [Sphingomonas sp. SUN039]